MSASVAAVAAELIMEVSPLVSVIFTSGLDGLAGSEYLV